MKKKKWAVILTAAVMVIQLTGCGSTGKTGETTEAAVQEETGTKAVQEAGAMREETEIQVFIAASLSDVMGELADRYKEKHPEVAITYNADSSGTLMNQIMEGYECDIFFPAAQKQMNRLEEEGLLVEGTRANVLGNQVVVITYPESGTKVTGLASLREADSIALADASVPVGKYTRQALLNAGIVTADEGTAADITTKQLSEALGGVEINECGNVTRVRTAVTEQANEAGTVYYSDTYGHEDEIVILETVSYELTGDIIYPIAQVVNKEADSSQAAAASDFVSFILSEEAKAVFDSYLFDTDIK